MPQPIDMKRYAQLKTAGELPSPRGVAIAIIRLTQASDVSLAEIGRVIKGDPAFVGRLIKAANGLVAENRRAVVSVQEALMVLGLPAVRTLALGFSLLSAYRKGACAGFAPSSSPGAARKADGRKLSAPLADPAGSAARSGVSSTESAASSTRTGTGVSPARRCWASR